MRLSNRKLDSLKTVAAAGQLPEVMAGKEVMLCPMTHRLTVKD
jgi:hypothetical protein